ncbi:MAG TPA: crosslink repair DNA glycosylase YcaQ family protein [Actinophytocola sp.]|uniref:DNA glycosylase AlkZ-like family protein n=1 Tax=Actinophytocola sp. TaxID=1872138 RepID=UPI002DDCCB97|nr:crosslink repair DNA glycosylase YcaQ family protein [Actinophytocola sp.]HEV2779697.1 crosslink repair DNA glycosylase YcaQ family protein [Actinophytocola sp.]
MTELDRAEVVAHRARVQGLHGDGALDVLTIGVQDAPSGSADLALAIRTGDPRAGEDPDLVRMLSIRGAPHVHRRADLPRLRAALRPRTPAELMVWLGGAGQSFMDLGVDALAVVDRVVESMRAEFPGERASKGELSGAISRLLPAAARPWCDRCGVEHVLEGLFRLGAFLAGLELERGDRKLMFRLGPPPSSDAADDPGYLVREFARLAGPVDADDVLSWLDTRPLPVKPRWEPPGWAAVAERLEPVTVGGDRLLRWPGAAGAPPPPPVVLLPPRDPYLLGHRSLVVPDREIARLVWRAQVSPGVLLVDGEVRGIWRQRVSGRTISLHLTPFGKPRKGIRAAVDTAAELVAAVRGAGAPHPHVVWES